MKKIAFLFLTALFATTFCANIFSLEVPELTGPVMDLADIISPDVQVELEDYLLAVDRGSSAQIAVLTIPSLEGEPLEEYAIKVSREWSLGEKGDSKGVLLLVAYEERKIRIETGYGAEGDLTDAKCGLIIRNVIAPEFKDDDYSAGIMKGVKAIAGAVAPQVEGQGAVFSEEDGVDLASSIAVTIFFILYFIMFTGGLSTKFNSLSWLPWAAWFIRRSKSGKHFRDVDFIFGSSGHSSGFSGFGGSSSGGGFSGGGGGFGGGGASGGW